MNRLLLIAKTEWQYWLRSHMVLAGITLFVVLLAATSLLTALVMEDEHRTRMHHQNEAEATFLAQPDRHPHRMVHYGHYVFRAPAPLSLFDPGLDSVTGQSIFLEGHRQNSAMFADSGASADFGGLSLLTPALVYQLFAPLLIVLLGYTAVVREREAGVLTSLLAQGLSGRILLAGKALALSSFIALITTPLLLNTLIAFSRGESFGALLLLIGVYILYMFVWGALTLFCSSLLRKRSTVLATLAAFWLTLTLVLPSLAVNMAARSIPLAGKIETDLAMLTDLRKLGDGHNAKDPAFEKLRTDLLTQYGVEQVEDLPVNFRGVVAMNAEQELTKVLTEYAETRMNAETQQAKLLARHGWVTPTLAVAGASRSIAGTDLNHYHRFLREAEALRLDFVQGLNRAHIEKLSYEDDINRNKGEDAWLRARVDAANWQLLDTFRFEPAKTSIRLSNATLSIVMLWVWLAMALLGLFWAGGKLKP